MKRFLIHTLFTLVVVATTCAQERRIEHRLVVDIPFFISGDEEHDVRYDIDSCTLATSLRNLQLLDKDTTATINHIEFYSSFSPEGSAWFNRRLSRRRLATAERIVRRHLHIDNSVKILRTERYTPWQEVVLPVLNADSTIDFREEIMAYIDRLTNTKQYEHTLSEFRIAEGGLLWRVIESQFYDHLRKGGAIITVERNIACPITAPPRNCNRLCVNALVVWS